MKAIILAAGRGTRLRPITDTTPKPLIEIRGKSILESLFEGVVNHVSEIIVIVDYKKEMFREKFGDSYCGVPLTYKDQGHLKGTGAALQGIQTEEDVLVLYADTIFAKKDMQKLIDQDGYGCLVKEVENPEKYGIFAQDENGFALWVIEKPQEYVGNLANLWAYKFGAEILALVDELEESPRGEYELTDAINVFCKKYPFTLLPLTWFFLDISYPEDIEKTENYLREKYQKLLKEKPTFGETAYLDTFKNLELHFGISEKNIHALIDYSQDVDDIALQENTGDKKRFSETEKIKNWYQDEKRYVVSLVSQTWELAAIWWGRPAQAPRISEVWDSELVEILEVQKNMLHTSGVRIYGKFRGQKLAAPFIEKCTRLYADIFPEEVLCVDVKEDNIPMQKVYEKTGHKKVGYGENTKSIEGSPKKRFVYIKTL